MNPKAPQLYDIQGLIDLVRRMKKNLPVGTISFKETEFTSGIGPSELLSSVQFLIAVGGIQPQRLLAFRSQSHIVVRARNKRQNRVVYKAVMSTD